MAQHRHQHPYRARESEAGSPARDAGSGQGDGVSNSGWGSDVALSGRQVDDGAAQANVSSGSSGSDNAGATSASSGNAAVVTASTAHNAGSGRDSDRFSSGSGSGSKNSGSNDRPSSNGVGVQADLFQVQDECLSTVDSRHAVAAVDSSLQPSRHHHHRRRARETNTAAVPSEAASPGRQAYEMRLPPSDERAVLRSVPRTHATVVAHDLPPPPTSSDAWSASRSSHSRKRRAQVAVNANSSAAAGQPMVASVRLTNGGAVDSVGASDSSVAGSTGAGGGKRSRGNAVHVTMDDPILKKRMTLGRSGKVSSIREGGLKRKMPSLTPDNLSDEAEPGTDSSASEGGYAASSERQSGNSGSDSVSSENGKKCRRGLGRELPERFLDDTDISRPPGKAMEGGLSIMSKTLGRKRAGHKGRSRHHYHSRSTGRKMHLPDFLSAVKHSRANFSPSGSEEDGLVSASFPVLTLGLAVRHPSKAAVDESDPTVYSFGQDVMAIVCSFLDPTEVHSVLTQPLSKMWLVTYTAPQELWKVLCTSRPFYAKLDENDGGASRENSFPLCDDLQIRHLFGRYRLLYTSFVRCMRYLNRLQGDALSGRASRAPFGTGQSEALSSGGGLRAYFSRARSLGRSGRGRDPGGSRSSSDAAMSLTSDSDEDGGSGERRRRDGSGVPSLLAGSGPRDSSAGGRRLGSSMITDRLLRPTRTGDVDNVNLPWSCAIYSIVNWLVTFADVEGIQIMCLKCLPYLLEDESQRTTAQRAGLTDSVLRAMVLFPDSIELHTVAFHTLVLLARPLGGNEGMLFHTAMVNTRGIFDGRSSSSSVSSKNGIVVMLDSMRRFAQDDVLQAMSCWSLVNVALTPLQKRMLVKLGGLTVTANAMLQHPYIAEVQFRALFALINLVIPSETRPDETAEMREFEREIFQQLGEAGEISEKEMLDASVGQIANLVVVAMKNFCSSEAILNRACLVLHNLSLNEEYHGILLCTPNCYQMLEWCLGNYPHDHVLQQSVVGTIQRVNATMSRDEELRRRFTQSIQTQQHHSIELARQEAASLLAQQRDQQGNLRAQRMDLF